MDYDKKNQIKVVNAIVYAAIDADAISSALNTMGFKSLTLLLTVGIGGITFSGSNKIEVKLTQSDDDSTYVAVAEDDVILDKVAGAGKSDLVVGTGGIVKSLIAAHAAATEYTIGYRGKYKYVKVQFDFSGTHGSPTPIGAKWLLGNPQSKPTNQGDYDDSHNVNA